MGDKKRGIFENQLAGTKKLDELIQLTEDYIYNGNLEKIIEITYSYRILDDGNYLNETLFEDYVGVKFNDIEQKNLINLFNEKLFQDILICRAACDQLESIELVSPQDNLKKSIFGGSLEYVLNCLLLVKEGIYFEAEKFGYRYLFSNSETFARVKRIEKLEMKLFGPKMMEVQTEYSSCYNSIIVVHNKHKKKLHKNDLALMERYLDAVKKSLPGKILEGKVKEKKDLNVDFFNFKIKRLDYMLLFDKVLSIYNLPQRTKLTSASSIYDGDQYLEIPRNFDYGSMSVGKIFKLLTHEIESHFINSFNGKKLLGNFRGAFNLQKEEGLAIFMEKIYMGHNLLDMNDISGSFFGILGGETLKGEEYKGFMRIMCDEYGIKSSSIAYSMRIKRNYSENFYGAQHKDTSYYRGLKKTIDYLKTTGDFKKLFLGKVGFDDLDKLGKIHDMYEKKSELIFPIFISDLIRYYLKNKLKNKRYLMDYVAYYVYVKEKYYFLDLEGFGIINTLEIKKNEIEDLLGFIDTVVGV